MTVIKIRTHVCPEEQRPDEYRSICGINGKPCVEADGRSVCEEHERFKLEEVKEEECREIYSPKVS